MPDLSVDKLGIRFVWECFLKYVGDAWPMMFLFAVSLLAISLIPRERTKRHIQFSYPVFFLAVTAFNPLAVMVLNRFYNLDVIYYRSFWLLPVPAVIAYMTVHMIENRNKKMTAIYTAACIIVIIFAGVPVTKLTSNIPLPVNIYKVPADLIDASLIIHNDSPDPSPCVFFDEDLNMIARQYDPSLRLAINRDNMLYFLGIRTSTRIDEEKKSYKNQKVLMNPVILAKYVKPQRYIKALRKTKTNYLVIPDDMHLEGYMASVNCVPVGKTDKFTVYKNTNNEITDSTIITTEELSFLNNPDNQTISDILW